MINITMKLRHLMLLGLCAISSNNAVAENITVFAAASMTNVLQRIGDDYQRQFPTDTLTFSFAGSSTLAKQIEQDAPVDIFVSADQKWADYLVARQPEKVKSRKILAENRLVLIAPQGSELFPMPIEQLDFKKQIGESYLAIGDDNVPVGRYAKKALSYLGQWQAVEHQLSKVKDVRAVLAYIARGELPLGIVYATDTKINHQVKVIAEFPPESYGKIVYPVLTLTEKPATARFFDFLSQPSATQALQEAGFNTQISP